MVHLALVAASFVAACLGSRLQQLDVPEAGDLNSTEAEDVINECTPAMRVRSAWCELNEDELDPISQGLIPRGQGVCIDAQCYDADELREWLRRRPMLPHNRWFFSIDDLDAVMGLRTAISLTEKVYDVGSSVFSVAFSPSGSKLAVGASSSIQLLSMSEQMYTSRRTVYSVDGVFAVDISADGGKLLVGCLDNVARLLDMDAGAEMQRFHGHTDPIVSVSFSPAGDKVATGSHDSTVRIWQAVSGLQLIEVRHADWVSSVVFHPSGREVLTGCDDNWVRLINANTGEIRTRFGSQSAGWVSAFSKDGFRLANAGKNGNVQIYDYLTGAHVLTFKAHDNDIMSVEFSPDGSHILTGGNDPTARLWNASTGALVQTFGGHYDFVSSVDFSPDGRRVATGCHDEKARIFDIPAPLLP